MEAMRSTLLTLVTVLGCGMVLLAGPVAARVALQAPPCTFPVPFPSDVRIIVPAPDIPPELMALSGVWEGNLGEGVNPSIGTSATIFSVPAVRVAVEQISRDRARIVFGVGDLPGYPGGWVSGVAPLQPGGRIEFGTTTRVTLTPSGDTQRIAATVVSGNLRFGTIMTRCSAGETIAQ